jgi:prenyltransferase beta subunit
MADCGDVGMTFYRRELLEYFRVIGQRLPSAMSSFSPQRLLILYFSVAGRTALSQALRSNFVEDERSEEYSDAEKQLLLEHLLQCQDPVSGGFLPKPAGLPAIGTGFSDTPTVTMTHCALFVLATLGLIDRAVEMGLSKDRAMAFLKRCILPNGSVSASPESPEIDLRFTYSALASCHMLRIPVEDLVPIEVLVANICDCQTHEGGFSGSPHTPEAHSGMTYCAVASLKLLDRLDSIRSIDRLVEYLVGRVSTFRAVELEEEESDEADSSSDTESCCAVGFNGRPNKPCDCCYSFWVGGSLWELLRSGYARQNSASPPAGSLDELVVTTDSVRHTFMSQDLVSTAKGLKSHGIGKNPDSHGDPMHSCLAVLALGWTSAGQSICNIQPFLSVP